MFGLRPWRFRCAVAIDPVERAFTGLPDSQAKPADHLTRWVIAGTGSVFAPSSVHFPWIEEFFPGQAPWLDRQQCRAAGY
tara:strand:- start:1253 stop:1492 length:240 start_codon:yes stop_codon:yes gene_type:complete